VYNKLKLELCLCINYEKKTSTTNTYGVRIGYQLWRMMC